jgi:hypothetical protein
VSNNNKLEGDVDNMEVSWDDSVELGFKDDKELGTEDGIQFGIKHVVEQAQMSLS